MICILNTESLKVPVSDLVLRHFIESSTSTFFVREGNLASQPGKTCVLTNPNPVRMSLSFHHLQMNRVRNNLTSKIQFSMHIFNVHINLWVQNILPLFVELVKSTMKDALHTQIGEVSNI